MWVNIFENISKGMDKGRNHIGIQNCQIVLNVSKSVPNILAYKHM